MQTQPTMTGPDSTSARTHSIATKLKETIMNHKQIKTLTLSVIASLLFVAGFAAPAAADDATPQQIVDLGELAAYHEQAAGRFDIRATAAGTLISIQAINEPQIVEQIADLGELAEYQSHLLDVAVPVQHVALRIQLVQEHERFEQIADLGELAAYHEGVAGRPDSRMHTLHDFIVLVDHQTYQELMTP